MTTYIVLTSSEMGYGKWGKGSTRAEARKNAKYFGGDPTRRGMTVLTFDDETEFLGVDQMGSVHWKGNEPTVEEVAPK